MIQRRTSTFRASRVGYPVKWNRHRVRSRPPFRGGPSSVQTHMSPSKVHPTRLENTSLRRCTTRPNRTQVSQGDLREENWCPRAPDGYPGYTPTNKNTAYDPPSFDMMQRTTRGNDSRKQLLDGWIDRCLSPPTNPCQTKKDVPNTHLKSQEQRSLPTPIDRFTSRMLIC